MKGIAEKERKEKGVLEMKREKGRDRKGEE